MEEEKKRLVAALALCNLLSAMISLYLLNLLIFNQMQQRMYSFVGRSLGKICKRRKKQCFSSYWVKPGRTDDWWMNFVNDVVVDKDWKDNFRMRKDNFLRLCDKLCSFLEKNATNLRN
uniref:Uncharacterized protein n=1 Tax=Amphimedon queenslandica TaxID=400682 RepID=A0A1X7VJZ9_AMPQE